MGLKSILSKPFAKYIVDKQNKSSENPEETQEKVFQKLISVGKNTLFGKEHNFNDIKNYDDFKKNVPVRDYEQLKSYINKIIAGESDVLWKGLPLYFAKTSGTTSGVKYIPISKDSISNHINGARDALLNYINETGKSDFLDKDLIFLSGSPVLDKKEKVPTGRLSGIVNHHVPSYLRSNQKPQYETNCIDDWEQKLDKIIDETLHADMSLISGIPPWVQMYFDKLQTKTGKLIKDIFPDFQLFVYGGVNFEPYKKKLFESIGKKIDSIELFPASEGFFAFQDKQNEEGMLLLLNSGIFYEFIPSEEYFSANPTRISIKDVEINKNYALIINNNAGLWSYSIGDTIKFISKNPYRVIVSGRIKHFISAFGEHVIAEEVEKAMKMAMEKFPETEITEFTVAPNVTPLEGGLPYHEWLIAFGKKPDDINKFAEELNTNMVQLNIYYKDLIVGNILQALKISTLSNNAFQDYMKSEGKLGGQNKVPRLSNDREIADKLQKYKI